MKNIRPYTKLHSPQKCSIINSFGSGLWFHFITPPSYSGYPCSQWINLLFGTMEGNKYLCLWCKKKGRHKIKKMWHSFRTDVWLSEKKAKKRERLIYTGKPISEKLCEKDWVTVVSLLCSNTMFACMYIRGPSPPERLYRFGWFFSSLLVMGSPLNPW